MPLEIIGAGFGRTGTYSLKTALEQLGFGPCHHMSEVAGNPHQIDLWSDAADGSPDFESIFNGFRAAVDFPISAYWQDALAANPRAKVILTYRDAEDWYGSFSQTILPLILDRAAWPETGKAWLEMIERVIIGKALGGRTDRAGILEAYRNNEAAVRALEARGEALVFDVRAGWGPLCDYLGVETPNEPFPKTNPREAFFAAARSSAEVAEV